MKRVFRMVFAVVTTCATWQLANSQSFREDFNSDVFGSGSWTASDASVNVDLSNGWLHIGADGGNDDFADKYGTFQLPLIVEWRERLVSGGQNYTLPNFHLGWGPTNAESAYITYLPNVGPLDHWGWYFGNVFTDVHTMGPTSENQWLTVKAIIRSDGGELFAKADGDPTFTPIVTGVWSIPSTIVRIRAIQNWDAVCDYDYIQVTTSDQQSNGWCDDFENGLANWDLYQYPSGWAASTTNPHSGLTCAMFTFPSGAGYYDASMRSTLGLFYVEAGVTYSVTYWIREQNTHDTWDPNQSILDIGVDIGTGGANDRIAPFALPISSEWHFIQGTVTASASGAAAINVELHGYATSNDAVFAIDDICIRPTPPVTTVAFDIKPGSCPNPFNITSGPRMEMPIDSGVSVQIGKLAPLVRESSKEVLPVAILGTSAFDVSSINIVSIRLLGFAPARSAFEDVATPQSAGAQECACNSYGPDGNTDLTLKFYRDDIATALGAISVGETRRLTLTGKLKDGTDFEGYDCIVIVGNSGTGQAPYIGDNPTALINYPNPFNPVTTINFAIQQARYVRLEIYNALGQLVATLVDDKLGAGVHAITWDASGQASGLYLYRLTTSDFVETKKMLLLK